MSAPPLPEREGLALPARYRVGRILGEGGMGVVYDALDEERGHRVAVKTLKHTSPEALYRLKREFRALADLSHPNLVQLHDLVVTERGVFYTMEVVEGLDFVKWARWRPLPPRGRHDDAETTAPERDPAAAGPGFDEARLRGALAQLVAALRAIHGAGLVHRDVKPSNALVTPQGRLVLLDFGLAASRQPRDAESVTGLVGTVAYMSPEAASENAEIGPASDWYSVGVMLYEALTGRLPHDGSFVEVLLAKTSPPAHRPIELVPGIPADLDDLCTRLLAVDPAARPDAAAIAAAVGVPARAAEIGEPTLAPRFTGRAAELARLDEAVAIVRRGGAALAWVRGPSGIGKSALVGEMLARIQARHPDAVILRGRCYEQELVPFKAIDGLIDGLSRVWRRMSDADAAAILPRKAASLQRLFPVLARVPVVADAPPVTESPDPVEARARAFGALRELLLRLADRHLLVMFLDDLQWVDADTLHLLEELLRPPDAPHLLMVVSSRSDTPARGLDEAIARMQVDVRRIELGPLSDDDATSMVASLMGTPDVTVVDRIVGEAGGSPFFLGELVRYLQTVGPGAAGAIELGDVVRRRISLLPASGRRLLELIAVAGEPVRLRELAVAAGLEPEQVARDLRVLRVDHLVRVPGGLGDERVEPYHDRIRAAILDLVDDDARRRHHRALAVALGTDAAPVRLARHWAAAGDPARASAHARRAGDRATAQFDFDTACELYRMALDLGDGQPDATRRELRVLLAGALLNTGRSAEAAAVFLAAADGAEPLQRLELRRRAAEHFLNAGLIDRGIEVLRGVLAEIGEELYEGDRAIRRFLWSYVRLRLRGLTWTPRDESQIAPRELFRLECYVMVALSLGLVDVVTGTMYQAHGLLMALRLGEPSRVFRLIVYYGIAQMARGGRSRRAGHETIRRAAQLADASGEPFQLAYVELLRGFAHYFDGEFVPALAHLDASARKLLEETTGTAAELNHARVFAMHTLRTQGEYGELRRRFDDHLRDARARGDVYMQTTIARAFNVVYLAADDVTSAREALDAAKWTPPERGYHLQHWYELRSRAEVALYTREIDLDELARRFAALAAARMAAFTAIRAEMLWLRARIALVRPDAPWRADKELRALARMPVLHAGAWAQLGRAALATGDARCAALEATIARADAGAMPATAAAARWRLGEARGGADGDALIAEARAALVRIGVADPERMIELLAPGFGAAVVRRGGAGR